MYPNFLFWKALNLHDSWETSTMNTSKPFTYICCFFSLSLSVCMCRLTYSLYINTHFFSLNYLKIKLQISWHFKSSLQHVFPKKDILLQLSIRSLSQYIIILCNRAYIQISPIIPVKSYVYVYFKNFWYRLISYHSMHFIGISL